MDRGETAKPLIEARSGPSITLAEAAARMEVKDRTIKTWIQNGRCVGYPDISAKKRLRLPEWQFAGRKVVHEWVGPLLKAYGANGWAFIDFLTVPRHGLVADAKLEGESLLQMIQGGNLQLALAAAQRANPE